MTILFLLINYKVGGVETVTHVLANKFVSKGHKCHVFSLNPDMGESIYPTLSPTVKLKTINSANLGKAATVEILRRYMIDEKIDIVVNQSGHLSMPIDYLRLATKCIDVKIISVLHNTPKFGMDKKPVRGFAQRLRRHYHLIKGGLMMHHVYKYSDHYVLLSNSFIEEFKTYAHIKDCSKLSAISNPITVSTDGYEYNPDEKTKDILFVGRLSNMQKRIDRILKIWQTIQPHYSDWNLTLVGDGPDKQKYVDYVNSNGIKNVCFAGYRNPIEYYTGGVILLLTSDYEGFPLVLVEAMSFGVIPIAYGSYNAVFDIIDSGHNGFISIPQEGKFDLEDYTHKVEELIKSQSTREEFARNAIQKSKVFSVDTISSKWEELFGKLRQ